MAKTARPLTLLLAAALLGCDAPTEPTTLEVDLSYAPNPATASASTGVTYTIAATDTKPEEVKEYPWRSSFTVTIAETGGLAVDITAVNLVVKQASGGIVITPSGGSIERFQFNSSASGNRLSANGSASIGFDVWYELPNKGREALVTVGLSFRDDDNNSYSDSVDIRIAP
jgi:hypothetical protein